MGIAFRGRGDRAGVGGNLAPDMTREFSFHDGAVLAPFAGKKARPVGGGGEDFSFGWRELQGDGNSPFAEGGVFFERPAVEEFDLGFGSAGEV